MSFYFKGDYTFQDLVCLNRAARKRFQPLGRWVVRPLLGVLGLALSAGGLMLLVDGSLPLSAYLFPLVTGPLFFLLAVFIDAFSALLSRRISATLDRELEMALEEDSFTERSRAGATTRPYQAVYAVLLCRGRYFLFLNKRVSHILSKQALVQGDWEALGGFLEEKCGKPIIIIK